MALPTASTPGYGVFIDKNTGKSYVGCYCVIRTITAAEKLGLARGLIKVGLDIVQLTGGAKKSGNTHALGAAFDVKQYGPAWSRIWREMGSAFWPRTGADWKGNEHGHGVIDCAHDNNCLYQYVAYWRGYSGLGQATSGTYAGLWGYGSKDPDPWRPSVKRTWREGEAWALAEAKRLTAAPTAPTPTKDEDMELTAQNLQDIANAVRSEVFGERYPYKTDTTPAGATMAEHWFNANAKSGRNEHALRRVEAALARLELAMADREGFAQLVASKIGAVGNGGIITQAMVTQGFREALEDARFLPNEQGDVEPPADGEGVDPKVTAGE